MRRRRGGKALFNRVSERQPLQLLEAKPLEPGQVRLICNVPPAELPTQVVND